MNTPFTFAGLLPLSPEIVLGVGAMALLMIGVFRNERTVVFIDAACIGLLIVAGILVVALPGDKQVILNGSFVIDPFARFLKVLALAGSAAAILMSIDYVRRERQQRFEYSVLILLSTLGMMMLISAADLIALYL
ncbi:MAG TPA: NADH-quinone oxidoreductase subunit N, partial [Xanthobacteraceae bacterium]